MEVLPALAFLPKFFDPFVNRSEMLALTKKGYGNILKLCQIYCASRGALEMMSKGKQPSFVIEAQDARSAAELVQWSFHVTKCFKVNIPNIISNSKCLTGNQWQWQELLRSIENDW